MMIKETSANYLPKKETLTNNYASLYKEFAQSSNSIFLCWDVDGYITFFNRFAQEFFGFKENEILGKNVMGTIVPMLESSGRDLKIMIEDILQYPEKYVNNENENVCSNGRRVWIAWTNKPITNENGCIVEILSIGNDITLQKQAEEEIKKYKDHLKELVTERTQELRKANQQLKKHILERKVVEVALRESEEKFRSVVEHSHNGIIIVNEDFQFIYVNNEMCKILGYTFDELIGQDFRSFLDEKSKKFVAKRYQSRQKGELLPYRYEFNIIRKNEEIRRIEISSSVIITQSGKKRTVAQLMDITLRKRMEEELKRYTEKLEERVKQRTNELVQTEKMASLGQLVAGVAHEINNPLAYLKSNTQFILEDLKELMQKHAQLDGIDQVFEGFEKLLTTNINGLNRIATITNTLKRFSKPDTGEKVFSDINQGIQDTLLLVANQLKYRIKVYEQYGKIPEVVCNIGQINQVFMNLIINASQAMEKGNIWITTKHLHDNVFIEFKDNGRGIPQEIIRKIFDPFFTTRASGTGLGLSICYRIIKDHLGDIDVDSEVGKGTTIMLKLPINGNGKDNNEYPTI
ncbi:PAS domain S-box protein [Thermoproteota archaeon]